MKKLQFLTTAASTALATLVLTAALALTSCDKKPIDNPGGGNNNPGVPPAGTRLVDKFVHTQESSYNNQSNTGTETMKFNYDAQNRVVRIDLLADDYENDEQYAYNFSYGSTTVSFSYEESRTLTEDDFEDYDSRTRASDTHGGFFADRKHHRASMQKFIATRAASSRATEPQVGDKIKYIDTYVYNLNSDGYIVSGGANTEQYFLNGAPFAYEDEDETYESGSTYSYNNGYIHAHTYTDRTESVSNGEKNISTGNYSYGYTWTGGNLTGRTTTGRTTQQYGNNPPNEYSIQGSLTMSYSSKVNPASNVDLNLVFWTMTNGEILDAFGFAGKCSANLLNSITEIRGEGDNSDEYNFTWETDADGYVTRCTQNYESSDGSRMSTDTYNITYKN